MYTEATQASKAADLTTFEYAHILENYSDYMKLYPEVRNEEEKIIMKELLKHKS